MPRGPDIKPRKPRQLTRWRVFPEAKIQRIINRIHRLHIQLTKLQKELSNGQS